MDRNEIMQYYDKFLEEVKGPASEETRTCYKTLNRWFEEYISAVQEDLFRQAFQYGYEQGVKASGVGKTA